VLSPLPPGYEIVLKNPTEQLGVGYRAAKWIQERLLLGRLVWSRASLLAAVGVAFSSNESDRQMATRAGDVPNQNDLPSTWPAPYAERAKALGERILTDWRDRASRGGDDLFVLYVPRGEDQLRDPAAEADSWHPWLLATTNRLELPLIDPTEALQRRLAAGDAVYDDHWSPAGHEVIAEVLAARLEEWLRKGGRPIR
jgi:hypothetical protein